MKMNRFVVFTGWETVLGGIRLVVLRKSLRG